MKNRQLRDRAQREILPPIQFASNSELEDLVSEQLSPAAQAFLEELHLRFEARHKALLEARPPADGEPQEVSAWMRTGNWRLAPPPKGWEPGRVELHRPAEEAWAVGSVAPDTFVADFEAPRSWPALLTAHRMLQQCARSFSDGNQEIALRPRAWHLSEPRFLVRGEPIAASLFDFGLYLFHAGEVLLNSGRSPHLHLAKLEGPRDARLWNDVLVFAERVLGLPVGTIRVTLLIDTVAAAREAEELLYELRDHALALAVDPAAYAFSAEKRSLVPTPDDGPRIEALVHALCRRRGAQAVASAREGAGLPAGFDGVWTNDPSVLLRAHASANAERIGDGELAPVGEAAMRQDLRSVLASLISRLEGRSADVAAAERARWRLWDWAQRSAGSFALGRARLKEICDEELHQLVGADAKVAERRGELRSLCERLLADTKFEEYLDGAVSDALVATDRATLRMQAGYEEPAPSTYTSAMQFVV